jgi:hypothetical protein
MNHRAVLLAVGLVLGWLPSPASGQSAPVVRSYDDCITRYAAKAPSPPAAVILQRACFYRFRYDKEYIAHFGAEPEHKKQAKLYTPAVCDCLFERLPGASPHLPAPEVLEGCVKASQKPAEPISR